MSKITDFKVLKVGECSHPECIVARGGKLSSEKFPALVGLIKHQNQGWILYDTGYSDVFIKETKHFPNKLYGLVTPVNFQKEECLLAQLERLGINKFDINHIIISHFHADHISGLKLFKASKFVAFVSEHERLQHKNKLNQLKNAYINELIPTDFKDRVTDINKLEQVSTELLEFNYGYDLFGDNSLVIIDLPGHTKNQAGLLFEFADEKYFFVADATFGLKYLYANLLPMSVAKLITYDWREYVRTFEKLKNIKGVNLIPSHCTASMEKYCAK